MDFHGGIKFNIDGMQDAIKDIMLVKKQLQDNSLKAKGNIHCTLSRQAEALRSREVWLLDQVDNIHHIKQEILDEQLAIIQYELGAVKSLFDTASTTDMQSNDQLFSTHLNLVKNCLEAKENSEIEFEADHEHLRDTIYGYGYIKTKNEKTIHETEGVNRMVDENELCQSLTELKQKNEKYLDNTMWAVDKKEWLIRTPSNTPVELSNPSLFPQLIQDEDIGNIEHFKDEGDEMMSSPQETLSSWAMHIQHVNYFDNILTSPIKEWLQNAEHTRLQYEIGTGHPYNVMDYFRDSSSDTSLWLAGCNERKMLEGEERDKGKVCCNQFTCIATGDQVQNIEIENLEHLICMHERKEPENVPDIGVLCRANEKCESFTECVCNTNCSKGYQMPSVTFKNCFLEHTDSKFEIPRFSYFRKLMSENYHGWLLYTWPDNVESNLPCSESDWLSLKTQKIDETWILKRDEMSPLTMHHYHSYTETDFLNNSFESTNLKNNIDHCNVWKALVHHHSKYTEEDWRIQSHDNRYETDNDVLMSETDEEFVWLFKTNKNTRSEWLMDTIPDECGIVSKIDDVHISSPSSKWLSSEQSRNTVCMERTASVPCFDEQSLMNVWLKE